MFDKTTTWPEIETFLIQSFEAGHNWPQVEPELLHTDYHAAAIYRWRRLELEYQAHRRAWVLSPASVDRRWRI